MHELSIACELIDIASRNARARGATRVTRIDCRVGIFTQVDPRLLAEAFEIARSQTPCAAAGLHIESVPARAACTRCGRAYAMHRFEDLCPACGSPGRWLRGGDELELAAIELEIDDEDRSRPQSAGPQRAGGAGQSQAIR